MSFVGLCAGLQAWYSGHKLLPGYFRRMYVRGERMRDGGFKAENLGKIPGAPLSNGADPEGEGLSDWWGGGCGCGGCT